MSSNFIYRRQVTVEWATAIPPHVFNSRFFEFFDWNAWSLFAVSTVMRRLVPRIHGFTAAKPWVAGTSPAMMIPDIASAHPGYGLRRRLAPPQPAPDLNGVPNVDRNGRWHAWSR